MEDQQHGNPKGENQAIPDQALGCNSIPEYLAQAESGKEDQRNHGDEANDRATEVFTGIGWANSRRGE
jgi:hypothetical protein